MISLKVVGLSASDFSSGETRLGDTQIIHDGQNCDVIDGNCGKGATRLISTLKLMGIKNPYLHISHPHWDHRDGIRKIIADSYFKPRALYCQNPDSITAHNSDIKSDINALRTVINEAKAKNIPVVYLNNGDYIVHGDIKFKVYRDFPKYTGNSDAYLNDGSLCYWFPELLYLTTGDAGMWCANRYNLHPVFVKGGHHGNDMSGDRLKPSQMCPWLYKNGCRYYWDNDFSTKLTDFLMTGREDAINAGMKIFDIHGDIVATFADGKATIFHGGKSYAYLIPYNGKGEKATGEWIKGSKGMWYRYPDGTWATGWTLIDDKWYLFNADGWLLHGWQLSKWSGGKSWFFLDFDAGEMLTGWRKLPWGGGKEDYFLLDPKTGAMLTGWQLAKWSGGESWFYLDPINGNMRTGWVFVNNYWYYLNPDTGAMQTGWLKWGDKWCYLEPDANKTQGHCYVDITATIDGKVYRFDKSGYATEITSNGSITKVSGKLNEISASRRQFVIDIANYVRKYAPQYGVCVYSPIIAQAIHESGWGESKLSAKYHNYFGLKCGTKWTGKSVNMSTQEEYSAGSLTTISANFRAYDNMEEGVKGYFEFIQLPRYANLKGVTSPRQYLTNIKNDGYATGSQYVDHVMNLVNLYNLTQFDGEVPNIDNSAQGQREAIVSEAIAHVGVKEGTILHHKIIDRYNSRKPLPRGYAVKYTDAWCATFISYLAIIMGYTDIIPVECGCPQMIAIAKQMGIWVEDDSYIPKLGDIVLYDWQDSGKGDNTGTPDHIGIVEKVVGNTETIIEGNYQDSVKRRELAINGRYIRGYIVPKYK